MAQHDMSLDNATGANFRADLNNALLAIASNNSGSSAPSTTYALQFYADTTNNILKLRNAANDGFINLFTLAGGVDVDAASNFNEDVTFTGASANIVFDKSADDLIFNDNAKAVFGTSSDGLEIFHDASDSIINDNGTGSLKLQLGGSTKAEVVSGGLTVTGTLTATTLAGTLSTAAQTNVTSLGTLTGLTLSGDMTFTGASANITFDKSSNELLFADNAKASFGNNGDLVIRHDGSSSIVEDNGTGPLNIQTNNSNINIKGGSSASDTMAIFKSTEGVELFFNNSKKAETVTGGFTVTGTCTATAFAGDGSALTGITGTATTINNNADNRVITGSGTANTLNGESALTFDGSSMVLGSNSSASAGATDLIIGANTNAHGLTIYSGFADESTINFGDANSTGSTSRIGRLTYDHDGNKMIFTVNDSERMRINDAGTLNLGATSYSGGGSSPTLYIVGTSGRQVKIHNTNSGTCALQLSNAHTGEGDDAGLMLSSLNNGLANISNAESANMLFGTNNTTRMQIKDSSGGLMIGDDGTTRIGDPRLHVLHSGSSQNVASFFFNGSDDRDAIIIRHNGASGGTQRTMIKFANSDGNGVGTIRTNGSSTVYNTSSDYRLKENEVSISDGITRLKQLKPYRFNFKITPSITQDGFFAHETQAVVPQAVTGDKDETENVLYRDVDEIPEGKSIGDIKETIPKYQGIDHSQLVPLLVAAVQELITKVETLEAA